MIKNTLFLLLLITVQSCSTTKKITSNKHFFDFDVHPSITALIEEQVLNFPAQTELAVAFTSSDSVAYFGCENINGELKQKENQLSLFEIGSITKVFTAHLLVQSVKANKNQIDQPLSDIFEFDLEHKKDITLRQLATHSSGLPGMPDYFFNPLLDSINPYKNYTEEILLSDLKSEIRLDTSLIDKWAYSNYAVSLLGYILADQHNLSYEELLQKNILGPLNMSFTTLNRNNLKSSLVSGMNAKGVPTANWDLSAIAPAGGIISNTEDLSKYVIDCYSETNKVFPLQSEKVLSQSRRNVDQALGWMIYNRKNGDPYCYFHAGQTGGYASIILLQPEAKKSVIILSNISEEGNAILSLAFKLLKGLREGKYEPKK